MKLYPTLPSEGNDCCECKPDVDLETKTTRLLVGLHTLELGRESRLTASVRLCPVHLMQLFYTLTGWKALHVEVLDMAGEVI